MLLVPLMLKQYKTQMNFKQKMEQMKPDMDSIQEKLKQEKDPQKQQELQRQLLGVYSKHGVNPLTSMGCLPMLIQMPVLMAFYFAIVSSKEIASHSFLWFSLGHSDLLLTLIAGAIYFIQAKVSQRTMPVNQQAQMKILLYVSPILIMVVSFTVGAALPLYWSVGGLFLIIQTLVAQKLYQPVTKQKQVVAPQ